MSGTRFGFLDFTRQTRGGGRRWWCPKAEARDATTQDLGPEGCCSSAIGPPTEYRTPTKANTRSTHMHAHRKLSKTALSRRMMTRRCAITRFSRNWNRWVKRRYDSPRTLTHTNRGRESGKAYESTAGAISTRSKGITDRHLTLSPGVITDTVHSFIPKISLANPPRDEACSWENLSTCHRLLTRLGVSRFMNCAARSRSYMHISLALLTDPIIPRAPNYTASSQRSIF